MDSNVDSTQNTLLFKNLKSKELNLTVCPRMFRDFLLDFILKEIRENVKSQMSVQIKVSDSIYLAKHNVFWGSSIPSMLQKDFSSMQSEFKTTNYVVWLLNKIGCKK